MVAGVIEKSSMSPLMNASWLRAKCNCLLVNAIAFDPYTHGYYKVTERVGEAFNDGLRLKKAR